MTNKQKVLLLFCAFIVNAKSFSQDGGSVKINIFQPEGTKPEDKKQIPENQNMLKWNWSLLTRGVFIINYEWLLQEKLTAEVGLGLTYRDWIYELLKNQTFIDYYGAKKASIGGEAALRFYPKGHHNFEGIYLSPTLSYRKYSFGNQEEQYSSYSGYNNDFSPGYNFLDIQFKFGYQYESWWGWDAITDFYIGFAYRNSTVKYYEPQYSSGGNSIYNYLPKTKKESYPQPLLGFKLGIAF